jgi:hypothetical protein
LIINRYKAPEKRVDFAKFIKDMEFCDAGISPALTWAIELSSNILKSIIFHGLNSVE